MKKLLLLLTTITSINLSYSQFQINGDAFSSGDSCYVITDDLQDQSGNIWTTEKINLNDPFDFRFRMFFGDKDDNGADGFVFALQPISNTVGGSGGGLGFEGISPSFGVEFDTYTNQSPYNDPFSDHMAILKNGDVNHLSANNLAGPVDISPNSTNVEDNQFYWVRFTWDPLTKLFQVFHDCDARLTYQGDIIKDIFNGNPEVYWGVTGGTGLYHNRQEVCLIDLGSEEVTLTNQDRCNNDTIIINLNISEAYSAIWSPNNHISTNTTNTTLFYPEETTEYILTLKDECLNESKDTFEIFVPVEYDTILDSTICLGEILNLSLPDSNETISYSWFNTSDSIIEIVDSGFYEMLISQSSCEAIDTFEIKINDCFIPPVPNIFTPNGDNINEYFDLSIIIGSDDTWNLTVYNRWGKIVYEQLAYDNKWDGGNLNDGLYFYQIEDYGGINSHKGWVQIIR